MNAEELAAWLAEVLGDGYGGPTLAHNGEVFEIIRTYDAPFHQETIAVGADFDELMKNYSEAMS